MKQILFTILMGETVLLTKRLNVQAEKLSCAVIKVVIKELFTSIDINGKGLLAVIRHCLFKLIRMIISTKSYKEWNNGATMTSEHKGVRVTAQFLHNEGGGAK